MSSILLSLVRRVRPYASLGRWRLTKLTLLATGVVLLGFSSAFLLVDRWNGASRGAGAAVPESAGERYEPNRSVATEQTLDIGDAAARLKAERVYEGLRALAEALRPTPTATPTATAVPTPVPTEVPAPTAQPESGGQGGGSPPPPPPPTDPPPASEPSSPTPAPAPSCPTASMGGFGLALFNAINRERTSRGQAALQPHGCVVYVAQLRSNDMASRGYFSHTSPDGTTAFTLLDANNVPHGWAGENLARNNYPADQTVQVAIRDLMASSSHAANILSTNYTHLGVAVADDGNGMKYYTMVFIGPS